MAPMFAGKAGVVALAAAAVTYVVDFFVNAQPDPPFAIGVGVAAGVAALVVQAFWPNGSPPSSPPPSTPSPPGPEDAP